jgi:hypothetical protein
MSLVTDSLTAGGTLFVTVGSGLQAWNELRRYQAVLERLGIPGFFRAYKNLGTAIQHIQWSVLSPWFLLPVKYSVWHLPARIKELKEASDKYIAATRVITDEYIGLLGYLLEKQNLSEEQKSELKAELENPNLSEVRRNERNTELAKQTKEQRAELKALGLKSAYWALIMLGSLAIFVATCISIYSDLNP